jgi:hypothetical protein
MRTPIHTLLPHTLPHTYTRRYFRLEPRAEELMSRCSVCNTKGFTEVCYTPVWSNVTYILLLCMRRECGRRGLKVLVTSLELERSLACTQTRLTSALPPTQTNKQTPTPPPGPQARNPPARRRAAQGEGQRRDVLDVREPGLRQALLGGVCVCVCLACVCVLLAVVEIRCRGLSVHSFEPFACAWLQPDSDSINQPRQPCPSPSLSHTHPLPPSHNNIQGPKFDSAVSKFTVMIQELSISHPEAAPTLPTQQQQQRSFSLEEEEEEEEEGEEGW